MATGPVVIGARSLMRQAYDAGIEQRERIGIRVSPFYNERVLIRGQRVEITELLNAFFFAGYDGEPYPTQDHAVPQQSTAAVSGSASGEGGRTGEAQGVGAGDGLQEPARTEERSSPPGVRSANRAVEDEVRNDVQIPAESH